MIILMGIPSETPLRLLAEACNRKQLDYVVFNQRGQEQWIVEPNDHEPADSLLANGSKQLRLRDSTGLYLRTMDHTQVPEYAGSQQKDKINEMYARLFRLMELDTSCNIVNRPSAQLSNNSKPYQSLLIKEHGLDIPDTCITSNEWEARAFISKHRSVIYKSISGQRSIVKQLDDKALKNLSKIRFCPVQFQEMVSGFNVRVHVVGTRVFATRICSDAIDYRYSQAEGKTISFEPFELTSSVEEKCIRLAYALDLPFAGIDLMVAEDGRTICFEVNPSPGYSYYEQSTGQPISFALADYLSAGREM